MAIPVSLRGDFKASQLRAFARKTKDGPQARRLLTLAAIYDGATRTEAAKIGGVTLQIIRDWVMRCGPSFVFLARAFCLATVMRDEPPSFATNESEQR